SARQRARLSGRTPAIRCRWGGRLERRASFFFSSRRRHTSFSRDWSSDVCSSDLVLWASDWPFSAWEGRVSFEQVLQEYYEMVPRSEERRVGKEGKERVAPQHSTKREVGHSQAAANCDTAQTTRTSYDHQSKAAST